MKRASTIALCVLLLTITAGECRAASGTLEAIDKGLEITYLHPETSGTFAERRSYEEQFTIADVVEAARKKYFYTRSECTMKGSVEGGDIAFTEEIVTKMWIDTDTGEPTKSIQNSIRKYDTTRVADIRDSHGKTSVRYNEAAMITTITSEEIEIKQQLQLDGQRVHVLLDKTYPRKEKESPPVFLMSTPEKGRDYAGGTYLGKQEIVLEKARMRLLCHVLEWKKDNKVLRKHFYDVGTGILVKVEGADASGQIYSAAKELLKTNVRLKKP